MAREVLTAMRESLGAKEKDGYSRLPLLVAV